MKIKIEYFKLWVYELHAKRGYTYGKDVEGNDRPYSDHLIMVENEAEKRQHLLANDDDQLIVKAGCAGHDVQEDCGVSPNDIIKILGGGPIAFQIARLINDVSDVPGMNRTERALLTYPKIRKNKLATFVKMCDRFANTSASKLTKDGMYEQYLTQYPTFRYALKSSNPKDPFAPFWEELDELNVYGKYQLNNILKELEKEVYNDILTLNDVRKVLTTYYK